MVAFSKLGFIGKLFASTRRVEFRVAPSRVESSRGVESRVESRHWWELGRVRRFGGSEVRRFRGSERFGAVKGQEGGGSGMCPDVPLMGVFVLELVALFWVCLKGEPRDTPQLSGVR